MKTTIRCTALLLLLCSAGAAFAQPRPAGEDRALGLANRTVIFDGVAFAPGEFKRPDQALTWVVTREDAENGTVHVFTSRDVAGEFMNRVMDREFGKDRGKDLKLSTAASCSWPNSYSYFNKNVGCGGTSNLYMDPGEQFTNLDFDGWNNTISCVKAACISAWTTIYSCRNFQMYISSGCEDPDALFVGAGNIITDLHVYDFNNRTSSIRFCTVYPYCN